MVNLHLPQTYINHFLNWTACADFPTGVELADNTTGAPEVRSRKNAAHFRFLSMMTLTLDPKFELAAEIFVQCT